MENIAILAAMVAAPVPALLMIFAYVCFMDGDAGTAMTYAKQASMIYLVAFLAMMAYGIWKAKK